jgi:hypothetical protein
VGRLEHRLCALNEQAFPVQSKDRNAWVRGRKPIARHAVVMTIFS